MHTLGPWISDISNVYIVKGDKWAMVADCQAGETISYPESKDNAILIAAAPDMLHALTTIMENTESLYIREIAGEAIRKAKGE